jgi:hypothetical protein
MMAARFRKVAQENELPNKILGKDPFYTVLNSTVTHKHTPLTIKKETRDRVKQYSTQTGIPMVKVAELAINDWLDTIGAARLEALQAKPDKTPGTVIPFGADSNLSKAAVATEA